MGSVKEQKQLNVHICTSYIENAGICQYYLIRAVQPLQAGGGNEMHVFLTGAIQSGKSTIIDKVIKKENYQVMGFRTRKDENNDVYMYAAGMDLEQARCEENKVGSFVSGSMTGFTGRFNALGKKYLAFPEDMACGKHSTLIIMDEIGRLEKDAEEFRDAVLQVLDGEISVLGVVRQGLPGWCSMIADRNDVRIIEVRDENREWLPALIPYMLRDELNLSAVIMASGYSRRFGGDKLMFPVDGIPMLERLMISLPKECFRKAVIVARTDEKLELGNRYGIIPIQNDDTTDNASYTIRLGTEAIADTDGCMYLVGDQPMLSTAVMMELCLKFLEDEEKIVALGQEGRAGNPVIFPKKYYQELMQLDDNKRGKHVIRNHMESLIIVECQDRKQLIDIDSPKDFDMVLAETGSND